MTPPQDATGEIAPFDPVRVSRLQHIFRARQDALGAAHDPTPPQGATVPAAALPCPAERPARPPLARTAPTPPQDATGREDGPGRAPVHVLAARVDWLTTAHKVALSEELLENLVSRISDAGAAKRASVDVAGYGWDLRVLPAGTLVLRNRDAMIRVDPEAQDGWTVETVFSGAVMMRTTPAAAVDLANEVAHAFGKVNGSRVRRLDLCADVAGWDIKTIDPEAWVKAPRSQLLRRAIMKGESADDIQHRRGKSVTGYTLCPGHELTFVAYDKREELAIRGGSEKGAWKRETEEATWTAAGWDGEAPILRAEFRLRGAALRDLECRDGLQAFQARLGAIWGYCTRKWLRIVTPDASERLSRCPATPEWETLRAADFGGGPPAVRRRIRDGASGSQAHGATQSYVASRGLLPPPVERVDEAGQVMPERETIAAMTDAECHAASLYTLRATFDAAAVEYHKDLTAKLGGDARRVARYVLFRDRALRHRFGHALKAPQEAARVAA